MNRWIRIGVGLAVLGFLTMGCSKSEEPKAQQPTAAVSEENWEPESIKLPEGNSAGHGHDHSGHSH